LYAVEVLTPAAAPIAAAELRARLRLNSAGEDSTLVELLAGAVELFEEDTRRPVLATTYRQHLARWPADGVIVLGRGGVTAVTAVKRVTDAVGTVEDVAGYLVDLATPPARVVLAEVPDQVETAAGVVVAPVGYVEFTAGWANAAAVPQLVRTALMLMAAHHYEHREAFEAGELDQLPAGWERVTRRYRLGLSGDWGQ
jgi:uncharacterized phiE125 gp8 family phage protein